jgi:hypothetical protein
MIDLKIKLIFLFISILVNCYSVSVWQDWILSLDFQKIRVDLKPEVHLHFSEKKIILFFILQKKENVTPALFDKAGETFDRVHKKKSQN